MRETLRESQEIVRKRRETIGNQHGNSKKTHKNICGKPRCTLRKMRRETLPES